MYFHFPQNNKALKIHLYSIFYVYYFFGIRKHEFPCPLLNRRHRLWTWFSDCRAEKANIFSPVSINFKWSWTNFYLSLEEKKDKIKLLWYIRWGWSQKRNCNCHEQYLRWYVENKITAYGKVLLKKKLQYAKSHEGIFRNLRWQGEWRRFQKILNFFSATELLN